MASSLIRWLIAVGTAASLGSCGGDAVEPAAVETTVSSPAPSPEPTATPSPTPLEEATEEEAEVPEPVVTEHSGRYWAVYLAAGEGPELEDAIQYLTEERGLEPGEFNAGSDINCDQGAREVLGDVGPLVVGVYFETRGDAEVWAATLPAAPLGIARVQTFCLD